MVFHHSIFDGWSARVAGRDLVGFYEAIAAGRDARLPAMPIQFGDYAEWERRYVNTTVEAEWRARLLPPANRPGLPAEDGLLDQQGFELVSRRFPAVSSEVGRRLGTVSAAEGGTIASGVSAAVAVALSRYLDGEVMLGLLSANRERVEVQPLLGAVFDYLPLRVGVRRDRTFLDVVRGLRAEVLSARARRMPLGRIAGVTVGADGAGASVFDVSINFKPYSAAVQWIADGGDVRFAECSVPTDALRLQGDRAFAAARPISYVVEQGEDGGLSGWILANARMFGPRTIDALGVEFARTLEVVSSSPSALVADLMPRTDRR
jgi:hypothetical protein